MFKLNNLIKFYLKWRNMSSKKSEGDKKFPLTQKEAEISRALVEDNSKNYSVIYDLFLVIRKIADKIKEEKHDFEGYLDLALTFYPKNEIKEGLFLNFVGEIHSLEINGKKVDNFKFEKDRLNLDLTLLKEGENKIKILFSGDYNHNGVGLHHCIDHSDKKEYLYTQMEPYDCHRLFPCFDQPDIKAILKLKVLSPKEWCILSNSYEKSVSEFNSNEILSEFNLDEICINHLVNIHDIKSKNYNYIFLKILQKYLHIYMLYVQDLIIV